MRIERRWSYQILRTYSFGLCIQLFLVLSLFFGKKESRSQMVSRFSFGITSKVFKYQVFYLEVFKYQILYLIVTCTWENGVSSLRLNIPWNMSKF